MRASPFSGRASARTCPTATSSSLAQLHDHARTFPGFVEFKQFVADDGERVTLVTFDSAERQAAWRDDVDHRAAQQQGRDAFYAEYDIAVTDVVRRPAGRDARGARHVARLRSLTPRPWLSGVQSDRGTSPSL